MLETPKALDTIIFKILLVKILRMLQWTISRKPKKLQIKQTKQTKPKI
jgi:hypothetical protein